jgi:FecR-like protein
MQKTIPFSILHILFFVGCFAPSPAIAASEQVGLAVAVRNNVSQIEPKISKILTGDDVIRDELVETKADSGAKFVLKDSTNLVLGPNSTLRLDRAVFSGETTVADIAIKLALGSFRFITGQSAKEAYAINTPLATIGIRGTTLDFLIERAKNTVVLKHGQSRVCAGSNCVELLRVGDSAVVTRNGSRIDIEVQPASWSFDSACAGMCSPMSFADAENALTTGSIGGGGGGGGGGTGSPPPTGGPNLGVLPNTSTTTRNGFSGLTTGAGLGSAGFFQVSPH